MNVTSLASIPIRRFFPAKFRRAGLLFGSICIYRLLLDWIYFNALWWKDYPDQRARYGVYGLIASWLLLVLTFPLFDRIVDKSERDSSVLVTLLYLLSFVPFTTMVYAGAFIEELVLANFILWIVMLSAELFSLESDIKPFPTLKLGSFRLDDRLILMIGCITSAGVVYVSWRYTNFRLWWDLTDVYGIRAEAKGYNLSFFLEYVMWSGRMIHPFLLVYFFVKRRYLLSILVFGVQILSFGIAAHKSEFFMPYALALMLWFRSTMSGRTLKYFIVSGTIAFTLISIVQAVYFDNNLLIVMFVRRMLFVPNRLQVGYYDYLVTRSHELEYMRSGTLLYFLKPFGVENPYAPPNGIAYIIGNLYDGHPLEHANNGMLSDAVLQFGRAGVLVVPVIWVFIMRMLDRSTEGMPKHFKGLGTAVTIMFTTSMVSSTFTTVRINTLLCIVFLYIINTSNRERSSNRLKHH